MPHDHLPRALRPYCYYCTMPGWTDMPVFAGRGCMGCMGWMRIYPPAPRLLSVAITLQAYDAIYMYAKNPDVPCVRLEHPGYSKQAVHIQRAHLLTLLYAQITAGDSSSPRMNKPRRATHKVHSDGTCGWWSIICLSTTVCTPDVVWSYPSVRACVCHDVFQQLNA